MRTEQIVYRLLVKTTKSACDSANFEVLTAVCWKLHFYGMCCHIDWYICTNVSEELAASICRVFKETSSSWMALTVFPFHKTQYYPESDPKINLLLNMEGHIIERSY